MANTSSTTTFKADISQLKSQMQAAKRQISLVNSEFKAATAGMEDWTDSAEGLKAKLKQLESTLKSQKTQLSLLEEEYEKTTTEYGENSAAADRVKISINNMKASIAKTESQINSYNTQLDDLENESDDATDAMDELDDATANAGDGFTVFKGVLSDLISNVVTWAVSELKNLASEVVEVGSNFESSMSNVAALSGATEEELKLLSDTAKEFGETTQFSASEAADALSYMALAGWDAETSVSALGGVLDLAAASGMGLAEASDMVTDYMSAFGMEADESAYFADLLAYAQSNANTTAEGLGEAFKNCAANMSAAGQDVETTTALLSEMANQGLKGSEAGTALTAVMRDMTSKMEDGSIAIGETTVAVQDAEGNYRDLTDILQDVEDAVDGMGDAEKATALQSTFTSDSIKGLNLILNAGVDSAADFEEQLRNATGTASDMSEVMNNNLSGDITKLNSKLEGIKITIYESMAPALRESVSMISDVLDSVDWSEVGEELGGVTVKAVELFGKIIDNADLIKGLLGAIGTSLGTAFVVSKVASFATTIISLYKTFTTLKTATEAATTAQLLLNVAQNAMPIGIIVSAVAALATGLIYLVSKTKDTKEATETLTEYEQQEIDKVYELRDAYQELSDTRDENVDAINTEYDYYETLANELDELVDANGNVKDGYEDRVNFILTTLNDAVGTEMELVDGVIQNYQDEKAAIEDLIETKRAEAVLSANEDLYTDAIQNSNEALQNYITTQGIYNQNLADLEDAQDALNESLNTTTAEYADTYGLQNYNAAAEALAAEQDALAEKVLTAKAAVGESKVAMETAKTTYEGYQATIQNYEGLSSAIISGDADKISQALLDLEYNFQTAETSTKESLEQQVTNYETNLANLKQAIEDGTPGVTQEMVDQAQAMVDAAIAELDKLPDEAATSANNGVASYGNTFGSSSNQTFVKGKAQLVLEAANEGLQPNGEEESAGVAFGSGFLNGIGSMEDTVNEKAKGLGSNAVDALNEGQEAQSPSALTTTSGENFGQGFINGMDNKESSIWTKAWNLAKTALSALSSAQEEGSPSKLTYQSGKYFTQGYINGIVSEQKSLKNAINNMTQAAFKQALNLTGYNFSEISSNVRDYLSDEFSKKTDYMLNKMAYQNQKKLEEFDEDINKLTAKMDQTEDENLKKQYQKQIDEQEKIKDAYESASSEMLVEFSSAIESYRTKAENLINSTIGGITSAYEKQYNELLSKQNNLINKLKSAGDLFEISGAGIMTVNDITEQTKQIKEYAAKLQKIKGKVSADLFDEIASYDMDQGNAFMDRLLALSDADLKAYSDAYDEKMSIAEQLGEKTYKNDLKDVAKDYKESIKNAFAELPKQLEKIGNDTMKGFVDGLTKDTDYLDSNVRTFVSGMVDQFKKELKIKSPSRVMMEIGDYTGQGFVDGLKDTINNVKQTASVMAQTVATPLDGLKTNIGNIKANVGDSRGLTPQTTNVVNNYNLTQNNTSPKSLTALETYQARRQQIALVKAMT